MKDRQKQKYQKYQNQSLMALGTTHQGEPTKKTIEVEELFSSEPIVEASSRVYLFRLPIETEISNLVSVLTTRFSSSVIHAEQDEVGAQIILEGLQCPGLRAKISKFFDYFVFCCSKGLSFGRLQQTYNVILLTIRKQVIENQCVIKLINPYSHLGKVDMNLLFLKTILGPIQEELKHILKREERNLLPESDFVSPILDESSPTKIDIMIHRKVYDLFVLPDNKEYSRYKNIFLHSMEKIKEQMSSYRHKVANPTSVKRIPSPSMVTECFITQSEVLLQSLKNSYQEEDRSEMAYLHSLLCSETAETVTLFTIEQAICMYELHTLKDIYQATMSDQCQLFNSNVQQINQTKTDEECFEHLTLKKKYRLPAEEKPYFSAIQRLKTIQNCVSFREALLVIQQTFSDVKTDCYVSHHGKVELSSMDELLPVIIFVTVRAAVKNFPVWILIIGDYVRMRSVFELQQRTMTAFFAAIEDVSRGWQSQLKN